MKEYDIYLNKRLTESDITVYSLPYRLTMELANGMWIDCHLAHYLLKKFTAGKTALILDTETEFLLNYFLTLVRHPIGLRADLSGLMKTCQERFDHKLLLVAADLEAKLIGFLPTCSLSVLLECKLGEFVKTAAEHFECGLLPIAKITKEEKRSFMQPTTPVILQGQLKNLLYKNIILPDSGEILLYQELSTLLKRYRYMDEIDQMEMADLDDWDMETLDYVILAD